MQNERELAFIDNDFFVFPTKAMWGGGQLNGGIAIHLVTC